MDEELEKAREELNVVLFMCFWFPPFIGINQSQGEQNVEAASPPTPPPTPTATTTPPPPTPTPQPTPHYGTNPGCFVTSIHSLSQELMSE